MSPFTTKDWRDDPDHTTPVTAAALKDLEARLSGYTDTQAAPMAGPFPPWRAGAWYAPPAASTATAATPVNQMEASPLYVPRGGSRTIDQIACDVTTLGAGATPRLLVYADNGSGYPGALVADLGTVDASTAGVKVISPGSALVLPATGLYWLVGKGEGASATYRRSVAAVWGIGGAVSTATLNPGALGYFASGVTGSPDPFPAGASTSNALFRAVVRAA